MPTLLERTNRPGRTRTFNGFELTARKRFSNNWMLNSRFALNNADEHFDDPAGYGHIVPVLLTTQSDDPTEIAFLDGAHYAPESATSGIPGGVFTNARWLFKLSGMYALPWGISASGFYNARQGYPFIEAIQVAARPRGAAGVVVPIAPVGETRLDNLHTLDARVEKTFTFGTTKLSASLDVFNVSNVNTVLTRERQLNSTTHGNARGIVAPRVLRFGIRMQW